MDIGYLVWREWSPKQKQNQLATARMGKARRGKARMATAARATATATTATATTTTTCKQGQLSTGEMPDPLDMDLGTSKTRTTNHRRGARPPGLGPGHKLTSITKHQRTRKTKHKAEKDNKAQERCQTSRT